MAKRSTKHIKTKRAAARDDAIHFEEFMKETNAAQAEREAAEARQDALADEAFADPYLKKMQAALGIAE